MKDEEKKIRSNQILRDQAVVFDKQNAVIRARLKKHNAKVAYNKAKDEVRVEKEVEDLEHIYDISDMD